MERPSVLIFTDWYLPGYKGGGRIFTMAGLVAQLSDELCFKIMTTDRDVGDTESYQGIITDIWQLRDKIEILYLSPRKLSIWSLRSFISTTQHDILYLNSVFSFTSTVKLLLLRKLKLIPQVPLIVAPEGELALDALAIKSFKKHIYLALAKLLGLYRNIIWHASGVYEEADIRRCFGSYVQVAIAPYLSYLPSSVSSQYERQPKHEKIVGRVNIVFLSRISRIKNLDGLLHILKGLDGEIYFDIYGPLEDKDYWTECQEIINMLPGNIKVMYHGAVPNNQITMILKEYDLFFLPTHSESFGYVILEALMAGCPVLISDRTPWRGLQERGVGWDLPLEQPERFQLALRQCLEMNHDDHQKLSQRAKEYGLEYSNNSENIEKNRKLFFKFLADFRNDSRIS